MAAVFKYIKKAIVTITKGPRKGQKDLRYFYKGYPKAKLSRHHPLVQKRALPSVSEVRQAAEIRQAEIGGTIELLTMKLLKTQGVVQRRVLKRQIKKLETQFRAIFIPH